jgi:hypothetical protein
MKHGNRDSPLSRKQVGRILGRLGRRRDPRVKFQEPPPRLLKSASLLSANRRIPKPASGNHGLEPAAVAHSTDGSAVDRPWGSGQMAQYPASCGPIRTFSLGVRPRYGRNPFSTTTETGAVSLSAGPPASTMAIIGSAGDGRSQIALARRARHHRPHWLRQPRCSWCDRPTARCRAVQEQEAECAIDRRMRGCNALWEAASCTAFLWRFSSHA